MGMAAILVMETQMQRTFVPPTHWSSMWNFAYVGPVVSETMFEEFSIWVYVKQVTPLEGPFLTPGAIIWTILAEVHKINYIPNIKGLSLLVSEKKFCLLESMWKDI